jgi:hypothetical protein
VPKKSSKQSPPATKSTPPKPVKKPATKKPAKKAVRKKAAPKITDKEFAAWFLKQDAEMFIDLTEEWNEKKLKVRLKKHDTYDGWLNYFKTLSPSQIRLLATTGLDILPTEGYAALSFWHDIIKNPSRIKNIHRAGLTTGNTDKTIVDYAKANDMLGVLYAIRDQLAVKLQQGTGARDAGQLSAQMMEVMTQIEIQERKKAPTPETALGALMADMPTGKRPSENGKGHRHTSFASRVTIEDLEAANGKKK